jgi:hypothetical protein
VILNDETGLIESAKISGKRWGARQRNRLDTGQASNAFENFGLCGYRDLVVFIFLAGQRKICLVQIVSREAGIDGVGANEAFQEEP